MLVENYSNSRRAGHVPACNFSADDPSDVRRGPNLSSGRISQRIGQKPTSCHSCFLTTILAESDHVLQIWLRSELGQKASSTQRASQAVPHPSTDRALQRLASEFGRDLAYSLRYGRWRRNYCESDLVAFALSNNLT